MPASAYALLGLFIGLSLAAGIVAARVVGPWRRGSPALPVLAALGALWLVGHRLVVRVGPAVELFGWRVSLPFDVTAALGAAFGAAAVQRAAWSLLQAQQRRPGGDRLA